MSFQSEELNGQWASPQDCSDVYPNIEGALQGNIGRLTNAIAEATGDAQSVLRSRWPQGWPFSSPPAEVRRAVAVLAVRSAAFGALISSGAHESAEQLRLYAKERREWLNLIANSEAHLQLPATEQNQGSPAVAGAPRGEFGFTR